MIVLYWNVNGVSKVKAGLKLRELVREFRPVIICIAEPKIPYADGVMLRLNLDGFVKKAIHNSSSSSIGNLWILWSEDIEEPMVLNSTRQDVTVKNEGVFVSCVHASYIQVFRRRLWCQLAVVDTTTPWMDNGLFEADSLGSKFTWTNGQLGGRRIVSKLDRAIINEPWLNKSKRAPFRIQKMWFTHSDFIRMVEASCSAPVYGNPDFVFPFKLKRLKVAMKVWNLQVFGNVNARLSQAQLRFELASRNSDEDPFDTFKQNEMKDELVLVNEARMQQHIMLKQKSRNKWILEGSSNSSYFHSSIKTRRNSNTISELVNEEGCIIKESDQLRDHFVSYYENKFNGVDQPIEDSLFGYEHNSISHEERLMLDFIPSLDEIKGAVFDLNADSDPGPDETRLGKVLDKLVSEEQVVFMKGRNIHENISLASELVNELHIKRKDGNLGLKLDISQAFDTGNQKSLTNLLRLLEVYQQASGQRVCREKSKIYFGGGSLHRRQAIANFLGMGVTFFPDRYLGVKVMPGRVKYSHISNVVGKLKDHLSVYKGKMLSFQDRVVLIKSVLASYAIHNMVVYRWPVKFFKQSERVIHNFLWSGDSDLAKAFVVGYDNICSPVKEGGLGLTSLSNMNKALIMKLWWSIKTSKKNWARFLESKYTCRDGRLKMAGVKSSIFPGIRWVHTEVMRNTKYLIGDGRATSLFFDVCYGTVTLAEVLQRTDLDRRARVSDIIVQNQWHLEGEHMRDLASAGVARENLPRRLMGSDERIWMPDLKGMFSVRSARDLVRSKYPLLLEANLLWRRVVHPDLAAQNWKFVRVACANLDKVKSRFKIALPSRCSVCQIEEESLEHILWRCSAAKRAWQWLEGNFHLKSCYNLIASNKQEKGCNRMVKDLWLVSNMVVRSELWFQRNKMVYEKKKPCWNFFKKRVFNFIHEYSDRMNGCMLNRVEDLEILVFSE
ncbi:uncharacterized protein LOC113295597 [Papaver somniferum]|uniref:uncharacterized protein LOC113295597 n=1 Tax=Papaver somniferum TaxID=3469 RepID=UPI000E6F56F8|nr:uncharacterized protein LOC113295597 [Papaver somniferum]